LKFSEKLRRLMKPYIASVKAYGYIAPMEVSAQEAGLTVDRLIKLDGNENPYGCSPRVRKALERYPFYHVYPDSEQRELRRELEDYTGVPSKFIVAGSGSDEIIDLIMRLFVAPGDTVVNCVPTFGMYPFSTESWGGIVVSVPRDEHFGIDLPATKSAIDNGAKVVFIASPNNPSGNTTPLSHILELLETPVMVVVDEAYYEFSGKTVIRLVQEHDNLVVLRTFSKWAGLAGLRVGYGVFPEWAIGYLMTVKPPYNVNAAAQIAAVESLRDQPYLRDTVGSIIQERQRLFDQIAATEALKPWPSEANFILCSVSGKDARQIYLALRKKGILIRYFDTPLLKNYLRISVGKPEENDALLAALEEIC
jgi:histidinol-phosphate aminotransferase